MTRTVALFGGSFNPPGLHHRNIVEALCPLFDEVVVIPCGPRPDKEVTDDLQPIYRAAMCDIAFRGLDNVSVELFDMEQATFTRTRELERRFAERGEVWHVVGTDLTKGGAEKESAIHKHWHHGEELWSEGRFVVIARKGYRCQKNELPPNHRVIQLNSDGSSTAIRDRLYHHKPYHHLVTPKIAHFIERYGLYRGRIPNNVTRLSLGEPRLLIEADRRNPKSREWAKHFKPWRNEKDPNFILVIGGDGTMLRAIRKHWRRRLPFFGVNAGHLGFLLNNAKDVLDNFPPPEMIVRKQPLIYTEVERVDGTRTKALSFNDVWVERSSGQTAWIEVKINERVRLERLVSDGVLLSTASGSTAYARAMGATPLLADTMAWILVGSNVMSPIKWKSALISHDAEVTMTNLNMEKRPLRAFADGIPQGKIRSLKSRISRIAAVELAFLPHHDMAEKIAQIQFPKGEF